MPEQTMPEQTMPEQTMPEQIETEAEYDIISYLESSSGEIVPMTFSVVVKGEDTRKGYLDFLDGIEQKVMERGNPTTVSFDFVSTSGKTCTALVPNIIGFMHNLKTGLSEKA